MTIDITNLAINLPGMIKQAGLDQKIQADFAYADSPLETENLIIMAAAAALIDQEIEATLYFDTIEACLKSEHESATIEVDTFSIAVGEHEFGARGVLGHENTMRALVDFYHPDYRFSKMKISEEASEDDLNDLDPALVALVSPLVAAWVAGEVSNELQQQAPSPVLPRVGSKSRL